MLGALVPYFWVSFIMLLYVLTVFLMVLSYSSALVFGVSPKTLDFNKFPISLLHYSSYVGHAVA
jgi:hypothetical protein